MTLDGKTTTSPVSVRMDVRLARLIRQAAAKRDMSRAGFILEVAVREARAVMNLSREEDFRAWLEAA